MLSIPLWLGVAVQPALAVEPADHPWGVGPRVGTTFIPGHLPMALPEAVTADKVKGSPAVERVRGDVVFGVDAVYYAGDSWRVGVTGAFDVGAGFMDVSLLAHYDHAVGSFGAMDLLAGGGVGVGSSRWNGEKDAKLVVPYYPLRVHGAAVFHQETTAVQPGLYAQYNVPANVYYTDSDGNEVDEVSGGTYLGFGVDLTVYIGRLAYP